jgi:hypothetical protein
MRMRFQPNPNFQRELGNSEGVRRALLQAGIGVKKEIPNHTPTGRTGGRRVRAFNRKLFADIEGSGGDVHVDVGTRWRLGHIIEFGSATSPAYAPVRKAVRASGLRFREGSA